MYCNSKGNIVAEVDQ